MDTTAPKSGTYTGVMMLLSQWIVLASISGVGSIPQDVCQTEEFKASCNKNEIIIMTKADYGRMQWSRCIKSDYGFLGCRGNLLPEADRYCSGRRRCKFLIPNTLFDRRAEAIDKCPSDLKSYLEADYKCMPVVHPRERICPPSAIIKLTSKEGHLASILTNETNLGSTTCPYIIEAPRDTMIKFTIMDFTTLTEKIKTCYAYATIKEDSPYKQTTVCAEYTREREVMTTQHNRAEVRIMKPGSREHAFILRYTVTCANPYVDSQTSFERNGHIGKFRCKNSGKKWQVTCVGYIWKGRIANCSNSDGAGKIPVSEQSRQAVSHKMSLILVITIALALGATILTVGILVLKWKRNHRAPYEDVYPKPENNKLGQTVPRDQYGDPSMPQMTHSVHDYGYSKENEYAYISDFPPSTMYDQGHDRSIEDRHLELYQARMCRNPYGTYAHGQSHVEQRPPLKPPKPPTVPISLPSYFELDPDGRKIVGNKPRSSGTSNIPLQHNVVMPPPPPPNELPTPTPSAYDHLINAGCTSNHKSV